MSDTPLRVDGNLFFGRVSEQRRFRDVLAEVLREPEGEALPHVFLLFGDGGIGKSTLLRRYRDIAQQEFAGQVTLFLVDWERERPGVGREHVGAETLLDALHKQAKERGWAHHFERYREALAARRVAEQQALSVLSGMDGRDELAPLRGLDGERTMRFMRLGTRGERLARFLRDAGLRVEAEEARHLRAVAENRLRASRLSAEALDLFLTPHEQLAQALAAGFREMAAARPLLVALDTYEVMARADLWLRRLMLAAGPRLLWVVAGRDNLVGDRDLGGEFVGGYASDFPGRLVDLDMKQLAESDIRAYFAAAVRERPLEAEAGVLEGIRRATRGIPLAVRQAADIWKRGHSLANIVGDSSDATPGPEIVQKMTARYFLHCLDNEADQRALYALALAGGDGRLLAELLKHLAGGEEEARAAPQQVAAPRAPSLSRSTLYHVLVGHFNGNELRKLCFLQEVNHEEVWSESDELGDMILKLISYFERKQRIEELVAEAHRLNPRAPWPDMAPVPRPAAPVRAPAPFDLTPTVQELRQRYASVQRDAARLHDEPAAFLLEDLRLNQRERPWAQALLRRAAEVLRERVERKARDFDLIEQRCQDEDWLAAVVGYGGLLFWLTDGEEQAWRWLVPRLVEGLAYSLPLREGLLNEARRWKGHLSHQGRNRLVALNAASDGWLTPDERATILEELECLAKRGWLAGEGEAERRAILAWQRGLLLVERKAYSEALREYEEAERRLPEGGQALKRQLGEALDDLAEKLMWPEGRKNALYSAEAAKILPKVVAWLPEKQGAWYRLGVVLDDARRYEEALAAYARAVELDPKNAYPHTGLGNVYKNLGRYEEALAAYARAVEFDLKNASPHIGLGNVYASLGRYEEALAAYARAVELDPKNASPHIGLGNVCDSLGRYEEALAAYARAVKLDPKDASPHIGLGNVCDSLGRYEEALAAYARVVELDPKDASPHIGLGDVCDSLGRYEEALAAYARAVGLDATDSSPHHRLGNVYASLGRYEEAIAAYERAVTLDAKYAYPHNGLGNVYQKQGRYEEAIAAYERAIDLGGKDAFIYTSLMSVYRKVGRTKDYEAMLSIARELITGAGIYDRACFESLCGNREEALSLLKRALDAREQTVEWARRDSDFDFIRDDPRFRALVGEDAPGVQEDSTG